MGVWSSLEHQHTIEGQGFVKEGNRETVLACFFVAQADIEKCDRVWALSRHAYMVHEQRSLVLGELHLVEAPTKVCRKDSTTPKAEGGTPCKTHVGV